MRKIISIALVLLMVMSTFTFVASAADDGVYISYTNGNNQNSGFAANEAKKSLGTASGDGAIALLQGGGTLVVSEKLYFGGDYTWNTRGEVTITANYGGVDYKNPQPATNPAAGSMKLAGGKTLTLESDLVIDDVILFQEGEQNTIRVKDGATLTVTEKVVTMTKQSYYLKVLVEKGGTAIINGGTFSNVSGDGDITIGAKANVLSTEKEVIVVGSVEKNEDARFLSYSGSNTNNGLTSETPLKGYGDGIFKALPDGGTVIVCGKSYIAGTDGSNSFTFPAFKNPLVFTSVYDGIDYKNPEPATNPACAFKMGSGTVLNLEGDVVFDNIILFQENGQNKIVVKSGASLTINENVICMSKQPYYFNIVVEAGGKATVNGGTFSNVSGEGEIVIGEKANILSGDNAKPAGPSDGATDVCFLNYAGNNKNDGSSADKAVKGYNEGVLKVLTNGGTVVVCGKSYISGTADVNAYTLPSLSSPLVFTSVWEGVDYKNPEPANNPACAFKMGSGTVLNLAGDVVFDDLILFQENNQNTIHVLDGATLIITDKTQFMTKPGNDYHYKLVIDGAATAIISEEAQKVFDIENNGTLLTYESDEKEESKTEVKLTINSTTAYINGKAQTLDAAPINRNNRTMLPVRFLANAFGVANDGIKWDAATRTATLSNATTTIVVTIDQPYMTVNGQRVELDSPAIIESNRTYLPVRAIANALGVSNDNIAWDAKTNTATLVK